DPSSVESIEKMTGMVKGMDYTFKQYGEVEDYITKTLLEYKVFRTTVYELTDKSATTEEIKSLWKVMCKCTSLSGSSIEDVLRLTLGVIRKRAVKKEPKRPEIVAKRVV